MASPLRETPFHIALLSGGLAGTSVDTLFFPLDTLKTRAQSSRGFLSSGGFSGVYRGLSSAIVGSAPGAAAFFTTYETLKQELPKWSPWFGERGKGREPVLHMVAASGGEVAACLIRVPTEVVKQQTQASAVKVYGGSWGVAKLVWKEQGGLRGFYRGFGSTVGREIPFTCLQFPLYERLKLLLASSSYHSYRGVVSDLQAWEAGLCGSVAGGVAAAITTPLDVAKTRIMLGGASAAKNSSTTSPPQHKAYPSNLFKTLSIIYREEGGRVLLRGIGPRVMWISLGGAVFLGVYEGVKAVLMGQEKVIETVLE